MEQFSVLSLNTGSLQEEEHRGAVQEILSMNGWLPETEIFMNFVPYIISILIFQNTNITMK